MPDFNEAQKCESLAHAACALGIAPLLKVEDLRNRNRDAQLYLLTEVYSRDLPDNIGKYVNEQLKQRGQNMQISGMAELAQPEILVQVLNTLNPLVKPAPGSGAV